MQRIEMVSSVLSSFEFTYFRRDFEGVLNSEGRASWREALGLVGGSSSTWKCGEKTSERSRDSSPSLNSSLASEGRLAGALDFLDDYPHDLSTRIEEDSFASLRSRDLLLIEPKVVFLFEKGLPLVMGLFLLEKSWKGCALSFFII